MGDDGKAARVGRVPGKGSRREERRQGRLCPQARYLVLSGAACSAALRYAADDTMPRADTCEMTRFHVSRRSKNAVAKRGTRNLGRLRQASTARRVSAVDTLAVSYCLRHPPAAAW